MSCVPQITIKRSAARVLRRLDKNLRRRIIEALDKLEENPDRDDLDIKPLTGTEGFRLRVGDWRILFDRETVQRQDQEAEQEVITVQVIRPRGEVYKQRKRKKR